MKKLGKPGRPARAERTPMPGALPDKVDATLRIGSATKQKSRAISQINMIGKGSARPKRLPVDDWADGEDMLEGLGGIDPDYDRPDDAVPPELRAQWRPSRFEGE